jgi:hypothetical protein
MVGGIKMPNGWRVDARNKSEEFFEISQTLKDPWCGMEFGKLGETNDG